MSEATQAAGGPAAAATTDKSLVEQILDRGFRRAETSDEAARNRTYLQEFVNSLVAPGQTVSKDAEKTIKYWIGEIDKKLTAQVNEILHHPNFQKLEGTWRGLHYLVSQSNTSPQLKIKVFNATKRELATDLEEAISFDMSNLFKKVYEDGYGILGGHPYGLMVGDYEFGYGAEDVGMLEKMAGLAAISHCPFVSNASPRMFGFDRFTELPNPQDLSRKFDTVEHAQWRAFRESPDSRYVGLTMPRVLGRLPYGEKFKKVEAFRFEEAVDGRDHDKYLWMGAAWAYAARVTDAFDKDGWFARTRGVKAGGKVEGLPVHTFTESGETVMKCPAEVAIPDRRENELANLGFLALTHAKDTNFAVFMGSQSAQKPAEYDTPEATANAALSAKFNLILSTSRFAHYLKVMVRDEIGTFKETKDCEVWLNRWIRGYTVDPNGVSDEMKAERPLSEARVDVEPVPGKPGWYKTKIFLRPHFQLEGMDISMRLVAEVPKRE